MGGAIERTIGAYNKIIGSMEARVLPSVRRFKDLGATGGEEIKVLEQIDHKPRSSDLLQGIEEE
jgi:DNA recombination protein RmuC